MSDRLYQSQMHENAGYGYLDDRSCLAVSQALVFLPHCLFRLAIRGLYLS